jgi:hypothetical protein
MLLSLIVVYTINRVPSPATLNKSLMNSCVVLLLIISHFVFLVAFVLFSFNLMITLNKNLVLVFVVFLVMALSIRVIVTTQGKALATSALSPQKG